MKANLNQPDLLPTTAKTLGEVYAFIVQHRIERTIATKAPDYELLTPAQAEDIETEAND